MSESATILAIDDDGTALALLDHVLTSAGYRTRIADSGELALRAISANPPDLVLLDVHLGGIDGFEVCRRLKASETTRQVPIILVSGTGGEDEVVKGLRLGAADYIQKPFRAEELLARVNVHLSLSGAILAQERHSMTLRHANEQLESEIANRGRLEAELREGLATATRARMSMISVLEDQRRAESNLRASEERFRRAVVDSPFPILLHAEDGEIVQASQSWCEITGYAPEQLRTIADWTELAYGERKDVVQADIDSLYALDRRRYEGDYEIRISDGTTRVWEFSSAPLGRLPDRRRLVISMAIDVTDRRRAEHELALSAQRVQVLLDLHQLPAEARDALLDFALDGSLRITQSRYAFFASIDAAETVLTIERWSGGVMAECTVGSGPWQFMVADIGLLGECFRQRLPLIVNDYVSGGESKKGTPPGHVPIYRLLVVPVFDGPRIVAVAAVANKPNPYVDADGAALTSLMNKLWEILRRQEAEKDRARLESQLQQAQKMESVGRLAGGVAHDFNNMLGVILGNAELALAQVGPSHPLHAPLLDIRGAAARLTDLTRQLLAFARKQPIAPKVIDLNEAIGGMLQMLRRLIGEDIDLLWQPEPDLWPVKLDASQIDQILANLCVNARDAIAGVGKVTIETGRSTFTEEYCAAHAGYTPGDYVLMAVSDDGCGMDKETLAHLFEPFFTTKSVGEGTGLGLATIYGIVKQNSGFINVYSEPSHGTTFKIYLPRHVGKGASVQAPREDVASPTGLETILLVEDEASILRMTAKALERQGYTVIQAETPSRALRLAEAHSGSIDLLMTDVVMPEMNGRVLARNLLALYPNVKCLFMSGYTANVIFHRGVLDDGVHFLQKPFSLERVAAKVREALDAKD